MASLLLRNRSFSQHAKTALLALESLRRRFGIGRWQPGYLLECFLALAHEAAKGCKQNAQNNSQSHEQTISLALICKILAEGD